MKQKRRKRNEKTTDNRIGAGGAKAISEAMKINTTLTELDLSGDDNIKESNRKRKKEEKNNEQVTKQEQKERKQ